MSLALYLEWRIAAQRFGRRPWQLNAEERAAVREQEARERQVIELALAAPEAADVHADAEVVRAAFDAMAEGYAARDLFLGDLMRSALTETALREALAAELRAGLVLEQIGVAIAADESEVRAYFERQRGRLVLPERRVARHILITINDAYAENSRGNALARLGEVAEALVAGADFAALAMRNSECPSALDGGSLGQVRRGQIYPELDEVLFAMEAGEVRAVESPLGFHLLRCDAVIPPQPMDFDTAAPAIRRKLDAAARQRALRVWLRSRRGEAFRKAPEAAGL